MATAAMAGAAGAAVVLYYTGWGNPWGVFGRRVAEDPYDEGTSEDREGGDTSSTERASRRRRLTMPRTTRPPSTWFEALSTLSETLRFTYSETLGKWPLGDLAFGINYLLRRQGQLHVAGVYAGGENQQLHGPGVLIEMRELLRLLTLCMHFSKKSFPLFLEASGFKADQVLLQEGKAGLLKPAFTVLVDHDSQVILLLIRGTHSIKDTLTAVTGAVVPFHHTVLGNAGVVNLVLGYAHCGMVAAARWIAQLSTPHLLKALKDFPTYIIKVVGHSLGGGTAALLTYILRECEVLSSTQCVCFAPAACMTWELAESGSLFVTTVINGSDLVPCFSSASVDDLRAEVTASAWVDDFREQIERTRILRTVYRSATALSSRLQSIASLSRATLPYSTLMVARAAQTGAAGAGAIWRPVSSGTQIMFRQAQAVVRRPSLGVWSCIGPRHRNVAATTSSQPSLNGVSISFAAGDKEKVDNSTVVNELSSGSVTQADSELPSSSMTCSPKSVAEELGEELLWQHLAQELQRQHTTEGEMSRQVREEEEAVAREIAEEEEHVASTAASELGQDRIVSEKEEPESDLRRFFPPGRIMHIVSPLMDSNESNLEKESVDKNMKVGLFLTDRSLYGKVRLSRTMVFDHFMPTYKHAMENLIEQLERELCETSSLEQVNEETPLLERAM
ncbi:unnamed protein product [Sphagnum troendelagicum]|uniref:Sn1-specific diacylglycerol lipase alpha n=1 Tax=Sphagnum troendelagicum TaxID=128251 RepID=A0ABP0TTV9_9BRYO